MKACFMNLTSDQLLFFHQLGLADIILHEGTQGLSQFQPSTLEKYPCLSALRKKVSESDGLKEYLEGRKESFI